MTDIEDHRYSFVIADDHQIVRTGLIATLTQPGLVEVDGLRLVGEASNGLEAIEQVKINRPDLLLLDISMPLASGAEVLTDIGRWSPDTKVVVLTAVTSPGLLAGLVDAGIDGLFTKAADNSELIAKMPLILRGGRQISAQLLDFIRNARPTPTLTDRERQTLNMLVAGKTNAEIAGIMGISPRTAEKHRASLMAKLDVTTSVELMARALKDGLIEEQRLLD